MPTGSRIRTDNVFGTVTDNPLTAGALTLNSAGLVNLAAVASNHAVIVLDPLRAAGAPEIVIVTAHTAAASSATITRGAYGTTARSHAAGVLWVHAPTTEDTIRIVTSGTRPSDPYRGQLVFETDTNSYVGRDTSDAWQTAVAMGAWLTYTPALTASTSNPALGTTGTIQSGRYTRTGRTIVGRAQLKFGTVGPTAGSGTYRVSLPVAPFVSGVVSPNVVAGSGYMFDNSAASLLLVVPYISLGNQYIELTVEAGTTVTDAAPWVWAASDEITILFTYEAAS